MRLRLGLAASWMGFKRDGDQATTRTSMGMNPPRRSGKKKLKEEVQRRSARSKKKKLNGDEQKAKIQK